MGYNDMDGYHNKRFNIVCNCEHLCKLIQHKNGQCQNHAFLSTYILHILVKSQKSNHCLHASEKINNMMLKVLTNQGACLGDGVQR